jgi:hypothetical protein
LWFFLTNGLIAIAGQKGHPKQGVYYVLTHIAVMNAFSYKTAKTLRLNILYISASNKILYLSWLENHPLCPLDFRIPNSLLSYVVHSSRALSIGSTLPCLGCLCSLVLGLTEKWLERPAPGQMMKTCNIF